MTKPLLSHLDDQGRARMVDVSDKMPTHREARAEGVLICALETLAAINEGRTPQGAVMTTAEIAAAMFLSVKTVESHRQKIKMKLDLNTSAELSREAVRFVMDKG